MSGTEWLVVLGAAGAIAWVNWYFFIAGSAASPAPDAEAANGVGAQDAPPTER